MQGLYTFEAWADTFDLYGSVGYEDANVFYYSEFRPEFNSVLDERTLVDASITYTGGEGLVRPRLWQQPDRRAYRVASQVVAGLGRTRIRRPATTG